VGEPDVSKQLSFRRELTRKSLHLLSAAVPVVYALGVPRTPLIVLLSAGAILALVVELARAWHEAVRAHFDHFFGALLREHERVRWSGATWLVLALLGLVIFTPRDIAIAGMWALSVGDAAAAIIGRALARASTGGKTIAGSIACVAVTLIGAVTIAHLSMAEGLIAALAAAVAERPKAWLDDNVRIAVAVSIGIFLWRMTFS
jgi:dolichol kinase